MGKTHRENGGQKHVSNTQDLKPIAIEKAAKVLKAIFLVIKVKGYRNTGQQTEGLDFDTLLPNRLT